jgi:menaquinone-dependent protoporphyrinogen oxidase
MRVLIVYGTREGQTRRIATRIADDLRAMNHTVDVLDAASVGSIDWSRYHAAVVASSVHVGRHAREIVAFAKRYRAELQRLSATFISVTLSEAGAEDPARSDTQRQQAAADVQKMIADFVKASGWTPARVMPVAGALTYSKYNVLVRFVMKRIARKAGAPTDTSRDYEFTNWDAVDRFAESVSVATTSDI